MPDRRRCGSIVASRAAKRPRQQQRHLYLILDDWVWGYSVRKISLPSEDDDDPISQPPPAASAASAAGTVDVWIESAVRPLPEPVVRLEAPRELPLYFTAAFGTKIMAMHVHPRGHDADDYSDGDDDDYDDDEKVNHPLVPNRLATVFDVESLGISLGPRPRARPAYQHQPVYIPVGDRLFALSARSFEVLHQTPLGERQFWARAWRKLPAPPLPRAWNSTVTAYAVHPAGGERTMFFSAVSGITVSTYAVDTAEEESSGWERRGGWTLPFTGRGHYDRDLNAWVGLAGYPNSGHLCACDVAPVISDAGEDGQCPAWKVSKENLLFSAARAQRHVGAATLVHLGGGSRYCVVQCAYRNYEYAHKNYYYLTEGEAQARRSYCQYYLRLTTCSLKYDENGDLTTGNSRRVRYYDVPDAATEKGLQHMVAFWM